MGAKLINKASFFCELIYRCYIRISKMKKAEKKVLIGRIDKADFPDLGLRNIAIKIDTGAFTSAIHCSYARLHQNNGKKELRCVLLDEDHPQYTGEILVFEKFRTRIIKNSFGQAQKRYVISSNIILFGTEMKLELSLSERGELKYPILLGRKLLNGYFIVDTSKKNLSFKQKKALKK